MSHIAWLGTGLLGSGFVEALRARGEAVTVWNRTIAKASPLKPHGAVVVETAVEAVRGASRVHLCLSDDTAVEAVLAAIVPALAQDVPIIDHTTVSPTGARARQQRLAEQGVSFLACPVFMAPAAARAKQGMMLCASQPELVTKWAPELRKMTGELIEVGPEAARAAALKLMGNAVLLSVAGTIADVLTLGQANGIAPEDTMSLVSRFPIAGIFSGRGARMAKGDYAASFELTMAKKDVGLMLDASGGAPLAVLRGLEARMDELVRSGFGADDLGVLAVGAVPKKTS